jgi:hypothetical protein
LEFQDTFWAYDEDPGGGAVQFNILDAGDPHRFKVTREGAGMGWEFQDTLWAYESQPDTDAPTAAPTAASTDDASVNLYRIATTDGAGRRMLSCSCSGFIRSSCQTFCNSNAPTDYPTSQPTLPHAHRRADRRAHRAHRHAY